MQAYLGDNKIKTKYLKRVRAHQKADEIAKGFYWENGKGCAVGCTIEGSDHERYETELGIPKEIAYLEDTIFENLPNDKAKEFPARFLKAIKVGADLSKVTAHFIVWQFEDAEWGLKNIQEVKDDKEVYGFCEEVVGLYKRVIADEVVTEQEFYDLYLKIDGTRARTRARTGAWAWAWAWTGARAWAGVWAWAGARTWAWAGAWTYEAMADKLIALLEEAPQHNNHDTPTEPLQG